MKTIKEVVPAQLKSIRSRALRQLAMGKISDPDCNYITRSIDELEGYILNMEEKEE